MFVMTVKFDRKKAAFTVVMAGLVLIGIILLAGLHSRASADNGEIVRVNSESSRVAYLRQYGWEVESPAIDHETVVIPRTFSEVFEAYNAIQLQQGFDLSRFCGEEVEKYTYLISNMPDEGEVYAELYIYKNRVIGGDVHSTALDGFIRGIKE